MRRLASLSTQASLNAVPRNATQPGAEFGRFPQRPEILPCANKRLLGHVLALAQVSDGAIRQGADQGLVPLYNLAEGIPVSIQALSHQINIVGFRRMHRVG
jgi:hypothetical protein